LESEQKGQWSLLVYLTISDHQHEVLVADEAKIPKDSKMVKAFPLI